MDMQLVGLETCPFCPQFCRSGFLEPSVLRKGAWLKDNCLLPEVWEGDEWGLLLLH